MPIGEAKRPPGMDTYTVATTGISWFAPAENGGGEHRFICPGCGDEHPNYWEYSDHICQTTELPRGNHAPAEERSKDDLIRRIVRLLDLEDGQHYTDTGAGASLTADGLEEILANLKWEQAHTE